MMTHKEVHERVRGLVGGVPFTITVKSTEWHAGRVLVDWTIDVARRHGDRHIHCESIDPVVALKQLEFFLAEARPARGEALDTLGETP